VLPKYSASRGGVTHEAIVDDLNPQWDRLLRRKVVIPYNRVWDPAPTEDKIESFGDQIEKKIRFTLPPPMTGAWGATKYLDGKRVSWNTPGAKELFHVQLLITPEQHRDLS